MATKVVNNQERFDWAEYPVQDDVRLEVYWRSDRGGHGPAASLYFYDDEVLRFDCFGGDEGHCHMNLSQTRGQRWYYPEGPVKENIKQAGFDIRKNYQFCILSHQDDRIRRLKIDQEKLEVAASQMESRLTEIAAQLDML